MTESNQQVEMHREHSIWEIEEGDFVSAIVLKAWPKSVGYGAMDDIWDRDGDSILAEGVPDFVMGGDAILRVLFPQGISWIWAARTLRKMADMLEGKNGRCVANLGLDNGTPTYARRLEDGEVVAFDSVYEYSEWFADYDNVDKEDPDTEAN